MKRAFPLLRSVFVTCALGSVWPLACGDEEPSTQNYPSAGGSGGDSGDSGGGSGEIAGAGGLGMSAGGAAAPTTICGETTCSGLSIPVPGAPPVEPCCPEGSDADACGLDSSALSAVGIMFDDECQLRGQPGDADESCPPIDVTIPDTAFAFTLEGCCRADTNTCGYLANNVSFFTVGLGCIEAEPFLEGEDAAPCGAGGAPPVGTGGGSSAGGGSGGSGGAGGSQ
jgi:hypothetical protein